MNHSFTVFENGGKDVCMEYYKCTKSSNCLTLVNETLENEPDVIPASAQTEVEIKIFIFDPFEVYELPKVTAEETAHLVYSPDIQEERTFCLQNINLKEIKQKIMEIAYDLTDHNQQVTAKLLGLAIRTLSNWTHRHSQD